MLRIKQELPVSAAWHVWLQFEKPGTCCRFDGVGCGPGEQWVMTVFNAALRHRPAVQPIPTVAKKQLSMKMAAVDGKIKVKKVFTYITDLVHVLL